MNKNTIVGIIVVIIIIVGGFLYFKSTVNQSGDYTNTGNTTIVPRNDTNVVDNTATNSITTTAVAKTVTVTYSDQGYSPKNVEINVGDSVRFVNTSSERMSTASNPHPTHTDYPEFDQYKSSAQGQGEFTFTFTKIGSWGYHNHFNPIKGGTVTVK